MDNNRDKLSSHVIVNSSSIQSNNVINNEDTITAPSSISNVTDKEEPFLSNALQASTTVISPDTEHQFLGNISIINRLYVAFIQKYYLLSLIMNITNIRDLF